MQPFSILGRLPGFEAECTGELFGVGVADDCREVLGLLLDRGRELYPDEAEDSDLVLTTVLLDDRELREGEMLGAVVGWGEERRDGGREGVGVVVAEPCRR